MDPDSPDHDISGIEDISGSERGGGEPAPVDGASWDAPPTLTVDGAASTLESGEPVADDAPAPAGRSRPPPAAPAFPPPAAPAPTSAPAPVPPLPDGPTAERIARYQRDLEVAAAVLVQQLGPEPDWQTEFDADPVAAGRKFALYQTRQRQLEQVERQRVAVGQAVQARADADLRTHLVRESQRLTDLIPEWQDDARARADKAAIASSLHTHGYSPQEINQLYDSRAVVLARKAMLYDRLMASRPEVDKRVADAPPFQRPGAGGPAGGRTTALARLGRSGSVDDAAALIALG